MSDTRIPNAMQIAADRVRDMPTSTLKERLIKATAMQFEIQKAREELDRGEWIPEDVSP